MTESINKIGLCVLSLLLNHGFISKLLSSSVYLFNVRGYHVYVNKPYKL